MRRTSLALLSFCLMSAPLAAHQAADTILHNGKIFTVNERQPWAEAIAIRGSRILAVGDDEHVRRLEGRRTRSIDLDGRVVVPGFNDAHVHFGVGFPRLTLFSVDIPGPGLSFTEVLAQVGEAVAAAEPEEWILAVIGEAAFFDPTADRLALDAVAPDNPVLLVTWSSHSGVINTAAMRAAGVAENEPDPFAGFYDRFEGTDVVNGVLHEYALFRIFRAFRSIVPDEVLRSQYEALTAQAAQLGVTSAQEMTIGLPLDHSARVLASADVKIRMRLMCVPLNLEESCRPGRRLRSRRVRAGGVKWLLDGTPVERSAALFEPYTDFPGNGRLSVTEDELEQITRRGLRGNPASRQLIVHTVGDRAVDTALAEMDRAAPDFLWRFRRPRIEHGDLIGPEQVELARRLGVTVVQNPTHLALDLEPALGGDRAAAAQPLKSLLDAGVSLALGSDGAQTSPFLDLFFAVLHPFHPREALSLEEAVTAYTRGSARAELQEWQKGSLKRGYLADLAVLSQDIFTIAPTQLTDTVSLLTLVGGEVVWDAGVLVPSP